MNHGRKRKALRTRKKAKAEAKSIHNGLRDLTDYAFPRGSMGTRAKIIRTADQSGD